MYSKIKESDNSNRSSTQNESDTGSETNTITEYDSPSSSTHNESFISEDSAVKKRKSNRDNFRWKLTTAKQRGEEKAAIKPTHVKYKNAKRKLADNPPYYTYETIFGIHLYRTSALKFKKYIKAPRVKVSIYDVKERSLMRKSDVNRNVVINMEPNNVDYILPIISKEGKLSDDRSFSFSFDENLIINEDIQHVKDQNVVIIFEIMDTVVMNFKTRWKIKNSDGWHYISWAFFKPNSSHEAHINKRKVLQLYKYRKSKRNAPILEHCFDDNRKKYPGTLEVAIREIKYQQEEIELSRPRTVLQKDKQILQDVQPFKHDEGNFIIASTSGSSSGGSALRSKAGKMSPLIKLRNFFRWRAKFECPTREMVRKQLARKCLVCRFNWDGSLLAYTEELDNNNEGRDIIIAEVPGLVQLYTLKGHTNTIHCLRWMHPATLGNLVGKQVLLSASEDHTCILWTLVAEGNYSLEVLPHPCPIFSIAFLQSLKQVKEKSENDDTVKIASGGSNAILHVWRIADKKSEGSYKTRQIQCQHQIHLEQEISKHDSHITDIAYSREFHKMYTGDVGGIILEWIEQDSEADDPGKVSWINRRSFSVSHGLWRIQIVEGSSIIYAATVSTASGNVATLHKIDTRSGCHGEILSRTLIKSATFNFVVTDCSVADATCFVLFTSDANKIACLNLKSDSEFETIVVSPLRTSLLTSSAATLKLKNAQPACIKAFDIVMSSATNDGKGILAVSLSSCNGSLENAMLLYGPKIPQDNSKIVESTKSFTRADDERGQSCDNLIATKSKSSRISPTNLDSKNISRLTTFFNEVLDKCDRIIRHGSTTTSGYTLANTDDSNSAMDIDVNDGVDSDKTSIKSDKTFTIDNISMNSSGDSEKTFGNTFSINVEKGNASEIDDNTFTLDKCKKVEGEKLTADDTDFSENLESLN